MAYSAKHGMCQCAANRERAGFGERYGANSPTYPRFFVSDMYDASSEQRRRLNLIDVQLIELI